MVYGAEAVLPMDLDYRAPRVKAYDEQGAKASHQDAMDQLDEAHDTALLHSAKYQQALRRYHGRRVWDRAFNVGDLVLRLVQSNKDRHKLSQPWEGPYVIMEVLRPGAYKLKTIEARSSPMPRTSSSYVAFTPNKCTLFTYQFRYQNSPILHNI